MIVDVTVFDNTTQKKLNEEPERIIAGEGLQNAVPIIIEPAAQAENRE